ncbi:FtsQ-type POTRA domain-containing protein [Candidatus Daviesbacteria bacterium]|nr:FtsQ-type POTRA domain-containing protein [Candidatus Daviesbacteria bacterium]
MKDLEINNEQINCANEEMIKNSSDLLSKNILFVNPSEVENNLKTKFICIKSVNLKKIFPDKVNLQITGRIPVAILSIEDVQIASPSALLQKFQESTVSAESTNSALFDFSNLTSKSNFLVDGEGVVFAPFSDQINLPKIYYDEMINLGQKGDDSIKNSLQILEKVKSFGLEVKEAKIYMQNLLLASNPRIIFKLEDIEKQLASLQLILNQAKMNEDYLEFIDLRFDKPIVKFAPKKNGER